MDKLFLGVLNMSLTGAFVIAAICLARLPLKKAPKIISYCLWAVAGFRLLCPFSIESVFSLIPFKAQPIPTDIAMQAIPHIDSGIPFINNAVSSVLPAATPTASVNPLQVWTAIGACVWIIGVATMLIYGVASFIILKKRMRASVHIEANIYDAENIKSPFVLGIFSPKIYLPLGLSEQERSYILLHERTHIRRRDHIVKFAAYFILCLHWFNPLAWVAFLLMGVDMEMSCDERVLKEMGGETKKAYSLSLLSLATERRMIGGSPLAFGEGGIKERVKNILNFKKSSRVVITLAVALVAVLSIGFAVNHVQADNDISAGLAIVQLSESIKYQNGEILFQIPADYPKPDDWNILVAGREEFDDGFSRSVHFLEEENQSRAWVAGMQYSIPIAGRQFTDLSMDIYLPDGTSGTVDLLAIIKAVPSSELAETYVLENMTERQKLEKLSAVTLYADGTARLETPLISSYALMWPYYYAFEDGELLIFYDEDTPFARFTVVDENTLQFKSATVPLFADEGARYASAPFAETEPLKLTLYPSVPADPKEANPIIKDETGWHPLDYTISAVVDYGEDADITLYFAEAGTEATPVPMPFPIEKDTATHMIRIDVGRIFPDGFLGHVWAVAVDADGIEHFSEIMNVVYQSPGDYEPREWLNYFYSDKMPWGKSADLELPEYPDTVFRWTSEKVVAITQDGEKELFNGMPVWNVYLADLTGDGLPEFCATISIGSGIIDNRVVVYDYAAGKGYGLDDRGTYDYALLLSNGRLIVEKTEHGTGTPLAAGDLVIVKNELLLADT